MKERTTYRIDFFMNNGHRGNVEVTMTDDERKKLERAWIDNKKMVLDCLDDDETSSFAFDGNQIAVFTLVPFGTGKENE